MHQCALLCHLSHLLAMQHRYSEGQKFGKHIDDSVPIEGSPGHVTGYTLLVYLSGTPPQQQGPIDVTAPKATLNSSSSSSQAGGSKAKRQKQAAPAATSASSAAHPAVQINTNALQQLVGGETVFYEGGWVGGCERGLNCFALP